jgi:prolyl-tRNA synthetase
LKGVPLRVAIGSRDMQNGTVELARRDTKTKEYR